MDRSSPAPRRTPLRSDLPRVGLVLGGGGITGLAYHAAVLAALEHDVGWDPRTADVVVGTSAGSIAGALLRRRVPASDLAAMAVGAPALQTAPPIVEALERRLPLPGPQLRALLQFRPPSPALIAGWLRRPWRVDPVTTLAAMVGDGRIDLAEHASLHVRALGSRWPTAPLWVCAVRQGDMRRVVIGRDRMADAGPSGPDLSVAVRASCAIPGYFRPVELGGRTYVDGGVRSPTNADVLTRAPVDVAIVVSPMSGRALGRFGVPHVVRRYASAKVAEEVRRLERRGIATLVVEPGPEAVAALGSDPMCDEHLTDIVTAGFLDAGDQLRSPAAARVLDGVRRRRARPAA